MRSMFSRTPLKDPLVIEVKNSDAVSCACGVPYAPHLLDCSQTLEVDACATSTRKVQALLLRLINSFDSLRINN